MLEGNKLFIRHRLKLHIGNDMYLLGNELPAAAAPYLFIIIPVIKPRTEMHGAERLALPEQSGIGTYVPVRTEVHRPV